MTKDDFKFFYEPFVAREIVFLEEVGSTNDYAKELGKNDVKSGTVVIAKRQNAGRGRLGRSWDGGKGDIYMSLLLKPSGEASHLTLLAGVCVANVLCEVLANSKSEHKPLIKWPNDIVIGSKKVCGILTEGGSFGAVLGIGINVGRADFPTELADIGTSLHMLTGEDYDTSGIIKLLLNELGKYYERFEGSGIGSFIDEYKALCLNIGRTVCIHENGETYEATCLDITKNGELYVKDANGALKTLNSGEVSVKGIYGSD